MREAGRIERDFPYRKSHPRALEENRSAGGRMFTAAEPGGQAMLERESGVEH
jgi:hypothetical protein